MKNKLLTLLLSLAISFGLWLYVVTVISPESESIYYNIPVELVGTDYLDAHDLIIVSETKDLRMNLTLKGKRSDLSKITSSNITIIADLSKITQPGEHQIECAISFQAGSAEVQEQSPEFISVTVAQQATKTIDVKPNYTGSVPAGYELFTDETVLDHKTVTVKGPKDVIDQIYYAGINVDLTGKTNFIDGTYPLTLYGLDSQPLINDQFVRANVTEVRAIVQIHKIKKVPLQFHLNFEGSGLQENMVTVYPQLDQVTLIGTETALAKVDDLFVFTIDLSKYQGATMETFVPELPDGVQCRGEILVHIQIPEMASVKLMVDSFRTEHVADGLTAQISDVCEVEIWGPKDIVEQLTAENIVGIVDCSEMTEGSTFAPVTFVVSGCEYLHVRTAVNHVAVALSSAHESMES